MELAFALGKHHPSGFSSKSRRGKENLFRWRSLSPWGNTTRPGFWQNRVGARNGILLAFGTNHAKAFSQFFFKENFDTMKEQDIANENFQRAKELLDAGRSIENTAREIGIKSKTSFENFFKTHAGITPKEYVLQQASERPFCFCETPLGLIRIEENNYGITSLRFVDDKAQNISAHGNGIFLASAKAQISEYFSKRRKTFDIPLSLTGSEFQKKVWIALQSIPYGETRSYKQIAEIVGNENAARAVGMANNRNPIPIIIPCHRVIGGDGKLVGYGGGIERKEYLLKMESE